MRSIAKYGSNQIFVIITRLVECDKGHTNRKKRGGDTMLSGVANHFAPFPCKAHLKHFKPPKAPNVFHSNFKTSHFSSSKCRPGYER